MKEAGYASGIKNLDFVVRDIATFKLWAVAIQAMLKEHLNIESQPARGADLGVVRRGGGRQLRPGHQRHRVHADGPVRLSSARGTARTARRTTRGWTNPAVPRPRQPDRARARRHQAQGAGPQGGGHPRAGSAADPDRPTSRSTTPGTTRCTARTRPRTSGSTTSCAGTTSGWRRLQDAGLAAASTAARAEVPARRAVFAVVTLLGVSISIFVILRVLPGRSARRHPRRGGPRPA